MTVVVTHTTPADGSFSATGAAAWNADHALSGVGTMAEQDANAVAITGGTINGATVGATTPAAGTFTALTATGQTSLGGAAGSEAFRAVVTSGATARLQATGSTVSAFAGTVEFASVSTVPASDSISINYVAQQGGTHSFKTGASKLTQFAVTPTSVAVNYVQVTGAATGSGATISAQGSDTNVGLAIRGKGSGFVSFGQDTTTQFAVSRTSSAVNYLLASGGIAGNAPTMSAFGSDTNISQVFQSKGTGAIDLAAGSSGVNISNGGTVTAITKTAGGSGYTTTPTVAISAPTTAGGVQATASTTYNLFGTSIVSGGTGYTVGDTLTFVGGTFTDVLQYTVTAVSGGVITGVSVLTPSFGIYSALPPSTPATVTGGTGTGATFNLTWTLRTIAVNAAGSGYVEQPTVTFSGGGGSGAAAYATVGSVTTIKSIGASTTGVTNASLQFVTPNTTATNYPPLAIRDISGADTGVLISPNSGYTQIVATHATTATLMLGSAGTNPIYFNTQGTSQTNQMRVAHTASAVNYVQVTGAATGGSPTISAQGSDSNPNITLQSKGTGNVVLMDGGGNTGVRLLRAAASGDTFVDVQRNVGFVDFVASSGVSNGDIRFTPKGTGLVRFGTYTANMALTIQGYIEIKDSGGTTRRLAVIA